MSLKTFKNLVYTILFILILIFYTKDINIFGPKFYKNVKLITNTNDTLILVNKNNKLKKSYIPKNLKKLSTTYAFENKYLNKKAKEAFIKLNKDSKKLGYNIVIVSAYRDYDYQAKLFDNYKKSKGLKYALKCSAKPGHSEHQTGLAFDVMGSNKDYNLFAESNEFEWMKENAHKYGFILRYPKGKEHITGFKYEPWHYRYVGVLAATIMHKEKLTLEEYHKIYID